MKIKEVHVPSFTLYFHFIDQTIIPRSYSIASIDNSSTVMK